MGDAVQKLNYRQDRVNDAEFKGFVENAPINIIYCDRSFEITYMNPKSMETLRRLEKYLPVSIDKVVGSKIDIFHKNPSHQRRLLDDDRNLPHQVQIDVGPEKLDLLASAIYDAQGKYVGTMVTWEIVTEKAKSEAELARIKNMMENAPVNVIYCDREFNINYMNPQSLETLKKLEKYLPVRATEVVGKSIDIFHKKPSHQRTLLSDDKNLPHNAIIDVGPEKLDLLATAIYDNKGIFSGTMVTWSIVTEKLKNELEMARMQALVENAPVNMMMADMDLNLVYMNPASKTILRTIEKELPRPVDKMVGTNIDLFHKNPSHQRRLLADDRNLPYRAQINLGKETLDLNASAIYNKDGKYIGPMVTWELITDKLKLIDNLKEAANQLAAASSELNASASQMAGNSEETNGQASEASAAAEEVSKGVETVATNTEEMLASIKEIARNANEASTNANETRTQAQDTNRIIQTLGESSQQIGNVIKVISSIAQQTNLLALNATIEAARAGDAGRGFAVVANEVKELAKQTANATEEITKKISAIQDDSKSAVTAIGAIGNSITKMNDIAGSIAASVEEQLATTNEVARVVQESNTGVRSIATNVKAVSEAARETSSGAGQVLEAARSLQDLADRLTSLVTQIKI